MCCGAAQADEGHVWRAGQHVEALGGKPGGQEVYVLLFATFNCLGRMVCGFGSEWLLHRFAIPR